jgi:hypothetical protein
MHGATSFGQKLSPDSSALVTWLSRLFAHQLVDSVLDIFIELSASSDSAFASLLHLTSSSSTRSRSSIMTAGP